MNTPDNITALAKNEVFVFGSNLAGRHGKGAAKTAMQFGATYGQGEGFSGRTYAIPTKDASIRTRPLADIQRSVSLFIGKARARYDLTFLVTEIGCGLAGYKPEQIAPMFKGAPDNVMLPKSFSQ